MAAGGGGAEPPSPLTLTTVPERYINVDGPYTETENH